MNRCLVISLRMLPGCVQMNKRIPIHPLLEIAIYLPGSHEAFVIRVKGGTVMKGNLPLIEFIYCIQIQSNGVCAFCEGLPVETKGVEPVVSLVGCYAVRISTELFCVYEISE